MTGLVVRQCRGDWVSVISPCGVVPDRDIGPGDGHYEEPFHPRLLRNQLRLFTDHRPLRLTVHRTEIRCAMRNSRGVEKSHVRDRDSLWACGLGHALAPPRLTAFSIKHRSSQEDDNAGARKCSRPVAGLGSAACRFRWVRHLYATGRISQPPEWGAEIVARVFNRRR